MTRSTQPRTPSTRCSQLSSTSSPSRQASDATSAASGEIASCSGTRTTSATAPTTAAGSVTRTRSTNHTSSLRSAATLIASRLLPIPPGPTAVTRRCSARASDSPCAFGHAARRTVSPARAAKVIQDPRSIAAGSAWMRRSASVAATSASASTHHVADKPIAAAVDRLDDPLVTTRVADRPPNRFDAARQRRLGHEPVAPNLVQQLGLGHHPISVTDQVGEDVEDLRLDGDDLAAATQLQAPHTQFEVTEPHRHEASIIARRSARAPGDSRVVREPPAAGACECRSKRVGGAGKPE